jgi:hypothetical protein
MPARKNEILCCAFFDVCRTQIRHSLDEKRKKKTDRLHFLFPGFQNRDRRENAFANDEPCPVLRTMNEGKGKITHGGKVCSN